MYGEGRSVKAQRREREMFEKAGQNIGMAGTRREREGERYAFAHGQLT